MKNNFEIEGWEYLKLRYFVRKSTRINFLSNHLIYLQRFILNQFDLSNSVKSQLEDKLKAVDGFISTSFWLIKVEKGNEKKRDIFENMFELIAESKINLIEYPTQNWFNESKMLKKELLENHIMSSFVDSATILSLLDGYSKYFNSLLLKKDEIWLELYSQ